MDFNKLFNTYSNNLDTNERSKELSAMTSPTKAISDTIQNIMSNNLTSEENFDPVNIDSSIISSQNTINDDILDALSQLDELEDISENDKVDDIEIPIDSSLDNDDTEMPIDSSLDNDDIEIPIDSSLDNDDTEMPIDSSLDNDDTEMPIDSSLDNDDTEMPIDSSLDNDDTEMPQVNFDELDEEELAILNEQSLNDELTLEDDDLFDIEHPEEEEEETVNNTDENDAEIEVPDFQDSAHKLSDTIDATLIDPDQLSPIDYETIGEGNPFDTWKKETKNTKLQSNLHLSETQIFTIRDKINILQNKDLRFKIREIVTNPDSYGTIYDELISLILIDASEDTIETFIDKHYESPTNNQTYINESTKDVHAFFIAKDVSEYQDTINHIKNNLTNNFKIFALYGVIAILTGTIAWIGVAQPLQINSLFSKGLQAIENNRFVEGEAIFQQALSLAGKPIPKWHVRYAHVYQEKNLINEAANKYREALAIDPTNIHLATNASSFYTNLGQEYYTNAIRIMKTASDAHPKRFDVWDFHGSLFIDEADMVTNDSDKKTDLLYQAIDIYQKFIINNPKSVAPYYKIIDIYIKIGDLEQINKITYFINQLNPKFVNIATMTKLAKYYTDRRLLTESERIFRTISPVLDQYATNVSKLQKLMETQYHINPNNISNILSESYYEFARYKVLNSDLIGATKVLTNALYFNANNDKGYNLLGEVHLALPDADRQLSKAKELFEQALSINPNSFKPHINIGHIYYFWDNSLGDVIKADNTALYHYRIAKAMIPDNYKNYLLSYNLGWLEYQNNDANEAIDLWSDIYKAAPHIPALSYALGSALYKTGNPRLAQVELSKAANTLESLKEKIVAPNPNNKRHREIYSQLTKAYNNLGVINANYAIANPNRKNEFDSQALLNFYEAKYVADQLDQIYNVAEYNIGVLTRPNIRNRKTEFDDHLPKQTSLENSKNEFNKLLLEGI